MDKKKRLTLNLALGKPGKTMDASSAKMESSKSAASADLRGTKSASNPFMNGSNSAASDKKMSTNSAAKKGSGMNYGKYDSVDTKGDYYKKGEYKKTLKKMKR